MIPVGPRRTTTTSTPAPAAPAAPAPKPAPAKAPVPAAPAAAADHVAAPTTIDAERSVIKSAAQPRAATVPAIAPQATAMMSSVERNRLISEGPPSMRQAADAQARADVASGQAGRAAGQHALNIGRDALVPMTDVPASQRARTAAEVKETSSDARVARREAANATRTAMEGIKAPVTKALAESAAAQAAAAKANNAADQANARALKLRDDPKTPNETLHEARSTATQANAAAQAAAEVAVNKGDAAIRAQHLANKRAEALDQPPPYPAAVGIRGTAHAMATPGADPAKVLGAAPGTTPGQAAQVTADNKAAAAATAVQESGPAQKAAQDAQAALDAANDKVAAASHEVFRAEERGKPNATRLAAQQNLEQAQVEQAQAQSAFNRADRAAQAAGEKAIHAEQAANDAARLAGKTEPYPAANGVKDTTDVARLSPADQKALLGATSGVSQADVVSADLQSIRTGTPQDRAKALEDIMSKASPEYRTALLQRSGPAVADLARDTLTDTGAGSDKRAGAVLDSMARAMDTVGGGVNSNPLQLQWQEGVNAAVMSPQEAVDLARQPENPPDNTRNKQITDGYHQFSELTAMSLGRENANWTTFGQHASAGAGEIIKGNLPDGFRVDVGDKLGMVDKERAQQATAAGNSAIFQDIGPAMSSYNRAVLGDPRWRTDPSRMDGLIDKAEKEANTVLEKPMSSTMRGALDDYGEAAVLKATGGSPRDVAQHVYRGNVRIAEHEQKLAQPFLEQALPNTTKGKLASMIPGVGSASEEATKHIEISFGGKMMNVDQDVTGNVPSDLEKLDDKALADDIKNWNNDKDYSDRGHSDASNWRDLKERMGFISHVFAANQQNGESIFTHP